MLDQQTLLHLEDDEALAFIVRYVLRTEGFAGSYKWVAGVADAIAFIRQQERLPNSTRCPPQTVVLTNAALAGNHSALEWIAWLRKERAQEFMPIVVLFDRTDEPVLEKMRLAGANAFVRKGRGLAEMASELRSAILKSCAQGNPNEQCVKPVLGSRS